MALQPHVPLGMAALCSLGCKSILTSPFHFRYRVERAGPIQLLDCEPWSHASPPRYSTRHVIGELACEPCGVINCSRCDLSPRACTECSNGALLHSNTSGFYCVTECPLGFTTGESGRTPLISCVEVDQSSSGNSATSVTAVVSFAAVLGVIVVVVAVWFTRKRTVASRRRHRIVHYIKTLIGKDQTIFGGDKPRDPTNYIKLVEAARRHIMTDVLYYSPHLGETASQEFRRASVVSFLSAEHRASETNTSISENVDLGYINELNGAIFLALEVNHQELIPGLIAAGADATLKHPSTGKLAVSQMLSNGDVPVVNVRVLRALLRAHHLDFDDALGQILRRGRHYVRLVDDDGSPIVLKVSDNLDNTVAKSHQVFSLDGSLANVDTMTVTEKSSDETSYRSNYSNREAEGFINVKVAVQRVVKEMARDRWRSSDEHKDTVVHCILAACHHGRLSEAVALKFIDIVLEADPTVRNLLMAQVIVTEC